MSADPSVEVGGGPSARQAIDGTTLAADLIVPAHLAEALRAIAVEPVTLQDLLRFDLNGDGRLDLLALRPGAVDFEQFVVLSDGDGAVAHVLEAADAGFGLAIVQLVDGPTLVAATPRGEGCGTRLFLVTAAALDPAGTLGADGCRRATIERDDDGRVRGFVVETAAGEQRWRWNEGLAALELTD